MPTVMLTAGEFCSSPGIIFFTAGAFGMCAGDKILENLKKFKKNRKFFQNFLKL
jgi:hypothetical protein